MYSIWEGLIDFQGYILSLIGVFLKCWTFLNPRIFWCTNKCNFKTQIFRFLIYFLYFSPLIVLQFLLTRNYGKIYLKKNNNNNDLFYTLIFFFAKFFASAYNNSLNKNKKNILKLIIRLINMHTISTVTCLVPYSWWLC